MCRARHDLIDDERGKLYLERYGRTKGAGWYSFDANGVHFIGLVNVVDLKAGGLGNLGNEQLEWLEDDVKGRSASQPIVAADVESLHALQSRRADRTPNVLRQRTH